MFNKSGGCDGENSGISYQMTPNPTLQLLDTICTVYFTIELIVRFSFAPSKLKFVRSAMNIIDLLALVPLYMQLILNTEAFKFCFVNERLMIEIMFILRIIRMFRIFHLVKHYQALQILIYALKASIQELLMLGIFLLIGMLVFATMIYYAERKDAINPSDKFSTIPVGLWWALITMTTVGYGDVYPVTPIGYVVGAACAVSGVLLVALTFPVISNNFTLFYTHVRSRRGHVSQNDTDTSGDNDHARFHPDMDSQLYQNAIRTSNGSLILNNRSFISRRANSRLQTPNGNTSANHNGHIQYALPKDASSMNAVVANQENSSLLGRSDSMKARSDDGVIYTGDARI